MKQPALTLGYKPIASLTKPNTSNIHNNNIGLLSKSVFARALFSKRVQGSDNHKRKMKNSTIYTYIHSSHFDILGKDMVTESVFRCGPSLVQMWVSGACALGHTGDHLVKLESILEGVELLLDWIVAVTHKGAFGVHEARMRMSECVCVCVWWTLFTPIHKYIIPLPPRKYLQPVPSPLLVFLLFFPTLRSTP